MQVSPFSLLIRGVASNRPPTPPRRRPSALAILNLLLASSLIVGCLGCAAALSPDSAAVVTAPLKDAGAIRDYLLLRHVEIFNLHDQYLGRIQDLGIDLENGRIIEVLVETDVGLFTSGRTVAVPPTALVPDSITLIYRLNISKAAFAAAPSIKTEDWTAADRNQRVAAAYRYFGQEPYFVERGTIMIGPELSPKVMLGYVERSSRITDLPVTNLKQENLGTVWTLSVDVVQGRIHSVIVIAKGEAKTRRVVPPMALRFNAARNSLILDDSQQDYADEPRFIYTSFDSGIDSHYSQEAYAGPPPEVALEQGTSDHDIDITRRIKRCIRAAEIPGANVNVGTLNERVTLRGSVLTAADRVSIAAIAVECSRLELVDDQISVAPIKP